MKQKLLCFFMLGVLLIGSAYAQDRRISGRVTSSDDGTPLSGVSIQAVGANAGTQTNDQGDYTITVSADVSELRFVYLGYTTETVSIGTGNVLNVAMTSGEQVLDEVLIQVPYGTVKKTAFVGSETTLGTKSFETQRVTSFTRALEGLVPGLVATNGGGGPGTNADVRVRGIGSISAGSGPLYVLDGVPYVGSNVSLNTDDIESVTVLKDASATALYGARGSNGVIMITTKKGSSSKPVLTANIRTGFQNRGIPEYDRVNAQQYYEVMWEATRNRLTEGNPSAITDAINEEASRQLIPGLVYNVTNVDDSEVVLPSGQFNPAARILYADDWEKVLTRSPMRQDYNVNMRGGSDVGNYFISLGYIDEPGVAKFSSYDRYTARVNASGKPTDWLDVGLSVDGALGYIDGTFTTGTTTSNPFYYSRQMGPIYPVWQRDASGNFMMDPETGERMLDWGMPDQMGARPYAGNSNLLGSLDLDDRSNATGNVNANTYFNIKFLKDFNFRTTLGGTYYNRYRTTYQNSQFGDAQNVAGRSTKDHDRQLSFTFNQVLSYSKTFGDHTIDALVGHENYRFQQNFMTTTRTGFPFPGTSELAPAATLTDGSSYEHNHRIEGYFSRVNYTYKDRYLLSASYRRDGNSRFFPGNDEFSNAQWGDFWSVGGGWNLAEESFTSGWTWADMLKLKVSYGEQGNEDLNTYYVWQSLYDLGWNNVNNPGAIITSLANESLSWETSKAFNVGVDFAILNRRLEGTIEWYNKGTAGMLFQVPLPTSTGISSIWRNVGNMRNRGIDVSIGYNAIRKANFDWRIDLNVTHFKNEITKLPEENRADGIIDGSKKWVEGGGIYDFWLREYAGVDPDNGDALFYRDVVDAEGNPTGERETTNNLTQASYYFHGSALPDFSGGLLNSFRYKNFELSFLLNFSQGGKFYDGNYAALMHTGSYGTHWHKDILNRWQKPGDVTDVPRVQNTLTTQSGVSTRYLFDRSFLNIKNISAAYNLPQSWLARIGVQNASIYANVDNVHLFSSRKGMDPQRSFAGTADWTYVPIRTFTFGVTLGL